MEVNHVFVGIRSKYFLFIRSNDLFIIRANYLQRQLCDMYIAVTVTCVRIYDKITNSA